MVFRWNPETPPGRPAWTAQAWVYRNGELVYSVENLPTMGAHAGEFLFSKDFRHFVFTPQVGQVAAIGFFTDGVLQRVHRIDELVRDMSVVSYSVTMASWENWQDRYFDATNNTLTIVTRDDITYIFDITTGEIIYDTAGDRQFIPPPEDSFVFFANTSRLPLWARRIDITVTPEEPTREVHGEIIIDLDSLISPRSEVTYIRIEGLIPFPYAVPAPEMYIIPVIMPTLDDATLSDWAVMPVSNAVSWGIVPEHLMSDFNLPITRTEFADLVITTYSIFMGGVIGSDDVPALEREIAERIPGFTDTNNLNVMIAAYLGLITGVGDGRFDPYSTLTREQAAAVLSRLVDIVLTLQPRTEPPIIFEDAEFVSEWAVDAVEKVQIMGIMGGVSNSIFAPQANYTREQSIVTMMRVFDLWHNERHVLAN
jgi:hypothetical protein